MGASQFRALYRRAEGTNFRVWSWRWDRRQTCQDNWRRHVPRWCSWAHSRRFGALILSLHRRHFAWNGLRFPRQRVPVPLFVHMICDETRLDGLVSTMLLGANFAVCCRFRVCQMCWCSALCNVRTIRGFATTLQALIWVVSFLGHFHERKAPCKHNDTISQMWSFLSQMPHFHAEIDMQKLFSPLS